MLALKRRKRRRSGGKASRTGRLLACQLMLTRERRLPPSRLQLTLEELKRIQEESASPFLREGVVGVKANNNKEKISDHLHLDKEKEGHQCWHFDWRSTPFPDKKFSS